MHVSAHKPYSLWGRPYMTSDARGREGVKPNLMISDDGGRGVMQNLTSDVHTKRTKNYIFETVVKAIIKFEMFG